MFERRLSALCVCVRVYVRACATHNRGWGGGERRRGRRRGGEGGGGGEGGKKEGEERENKLSC